MLNHLSGKFSFGFGSDFGMARYFDALPDNLKRAVGRREFRSLEEMKRFVETLRHRQ